EVAAESWPAVRDHDELHEALLTLVLAPTVPEWEPWFSELAASGRAARLTTTAGSAFWVAAERLEMARAVHPDATLAPPIAAVRPPRGLPGTVEQCAAEILRGWFESSGPTTAAALAERLALPRETVDIALAQIEAEGQILRGNF